MKLFTIFFFFLLFNHPQAFAWWTQKNLSKNSTNSDTQYTERLKQSIRTIYLYTLLDGKQTFVQTGRALVIDQKHMITSSYNLSRMARYKNYSLYVQQNNQLYPCQIKYLDLFNGIALIYTQNSFTKFPLPSDYDFTQITSLEKSRLLINDKSEFILTNPRAKDDGLRELKLLTTVPQAPYSASGSVILNGRYKISGIYLGKTQDDSGEYFVPISKLAYLFDKAKLSPEMPDPLLPQKQFQSQIKAFREKFIASLVKSNTQTSFLLSLWKIKNIPKALNCIESGADENKVLTCTPRLPLMVDPYGKAFEFEIVFKIFSSKKSSDLTQQVSIFSENYQKTFGEQLTCDQSRLRVDHDDSQIHFCYEKSTEENLYHTLVRTIILPVQSLSLGIFIHSNFLTKEEVQSILRPIHSKIERVLK